MRLKRIFLCLLQIPTYRASKQVQASLRRWAGEIAIGGPTYRDARASLPTSVFRARAVTGSNSHAPCGARACACCAYFCDWLWRLSSKKGDGTSGRGTLYGILRGLIRHLSCGLPHDRLAAVELRRYVLSVWCLARWPGRFCSFKGNEILSR